MDDDVAAYFGGFATEFISSVDRLVVDTVGAVCAEGGLAKA